MRSAPLEHRGGDRVSVTGAPVQRSTQKAQNSQKIYCFCVFCGCRCEVELEAEHGRLIVRAARSPRAGWAEAARTMRACDDDRLLDMPAANRFDEREWKWR